MQVYHYSGASPFLTRARSPLKRIWFAIKAHKIITTVAIAAVFLFYWNQIRPMLKYRACAAQASVDAHLLVARKAELAKGTKNEKAYQEMVDKRMYLRSDHQSFLSKCLLYYGLPDEAMKAGQQNSASSVIDEPLGKKGKNGEVSKK
ncbi:MAG: hypothetical protein FD165_2711 [Gammaproteobacteria bacterium]|nr:MAG: hypothetical protein FD165_2711 [Gammaproteobacteria bacterium]